MLMEVSKRLKELRKLNGLTHQKLADQLGKNEKTYSSYETGKRQLTTKALITIAELYRVSTDYVLGLTDEPELISHSKFAEFSKIFELINKEDKKNVLAQIELLLDEYMDKSDQHKKPINTSSSKVQQSNQSKNTTQSLGVIQEPAAKETIAQYDIQSEKATKSPITSKKTPPIPFKDTLKKLMKSKSVSAKELADQIGVAETTIYYYTNCDRKPKDMGTLLKLSKYFNVSLEFLFRDGRVKNTTEFAALGLNFESLPDVDKLNMLKYMHYLYTEDYIEVDIAQKTMAFPECLRELRRNNEFPREHIIDKKVYPERGAIQSYIAKRIGTTSKMVDYYEAGRHFPKKHTIIVNLAKLFDVSVDYMLGCPKGIKNINAFYCFCKDYESLNRENQCKMREYLSYLISRGD